MNVLYLLAAAGPKAGDVNLSYIWTTSTLEAKVIIIFLLVFSIFSWSVMVAKVVQMRRANKLNRLFDGEFRKQKGVLEIYDRRVNVDDCPLFVVYQEGCKEVDTRLKLPDGGRKPLISIKSMEHVKRTLEGAVASQSLRLESGL